MSDLPTKDPQSIAEKALLPREPQRFTHRDFDRLLQHCASLDVSDLTLQTGMPAFSEIYGRLYPNTRRILNHSEVSTILNSIYGPNGTAQLLSGTDIDTHYELKPDRITRYRYRVNATACLVDGHQGIQITLRTILK